jgi:hypothetical protein
MILQAALALTTTFWVILLLPRQNGVADAKIGVNWGRQSSTKLTPSMVVDLLMQNRVPAVKLYNSEDDVLVAFKGSGIEVTIALSSFSQISDIDKASKFVDRKIRAYYPAVNIKYVVVGNNALGAARFRGDSFQNVIDVLNLVQTALNNYGFGDKIKAILSYSYTGILQVRTDTPTRPSDATFAPDLKDIMPQLLKFNKDHDSPFMFDLFPIGFVSSPEALFRTFLDSDFAFFDNKSTKVITDVNGLEYHNIFDFVYDSFLWAITKSGYPDLKITVGQVGWPTDGIFGANTENAERFWKGLLPKVANNVGTPLRPGAPIEIYVQAITDEKRNAGYMPFARHWGIYRANGEPKYKIDLSGQGRDIYPTSARGLSLMPERWCVFNGDNTNTSKVREQVNLACSKADCTSASVGGSCGFLSYAENVSYAFNEYFQSKFQAEKACYFDGLGNIVEKDPSRGGCTYSVEVVQGTRNGESDISHAGGFVHHTSHGQKQIHLHKMYVLVCLLASILFVR